MKFEKGWSSDLNTFFRSLSLSPFPFPIILLVDHIYQFWIERNSLSTWSAGCTCCFAVGFLHQGHAFPNIYSSEPFSFFIFFFHKPHTNNRGAMIKKDYTLFFFFPPSKDCWYEDLMQLLKWHFHLAHCNPKKPLSTKRKKKWKFKPTEIDPSMIINW